RSRETGVVACGVCVPLLPERTARASSLRPERRLMWFTLSVQSAQGMHRALDERGGQALHIAGLRCAEKPDSQGENVVWGPCALRRVRAPADTIDERLFGPIVER